MYILLADWIPTKIRAAFEVAASALVTTVETEGVKCPYGTRRLGR